VPYGYKPVKENGGYILAPNPATAAIVQRMADLIIGGMPTNRIASDLNAEGIPTALGKRWAGEQSGASCHPPHYVAT
jgi:hypothetical protein